MLWNDPREPIQKASPSGMNNELREHGPKHALRVHGSRPVAADSSTACTRPSTDSGETATIESQGVQTSEDSNQPTTSGVNEGEISIRSMTNTSKRLDMVAFNKIKAATGEAPLVSAINEDDISTRRAWGLWVCLTDGQSQVSIQDLFKQNERIIPVKFHDREKHRICREHVPKKRMLIWEKKLSANEATRMNILHVGQLHNHVCPYCEKQEKSLFRTKIRVTQKKSEPKQDKGKRKKFHKAK
ncbi:UNVERIFIED_CONTAM: hypothetical protein Sradi_6213900 [Sesamum radiatum]|uniref:Uncharacterized protein n=1 Tax=Sesamum radiatum TaxID=300843 RepID=A0AAW2KC75_SESRA